MHELNHACDHVPQNTFKYAYSHHDTNFSKNTAKYQLGPTHVCVILSGRGDTKYHTDVILSCLSEINNTKSDPEI